MAGGQGQGEDRAAGVGFEVVTADVVVDGGPVLDALGRDRDIGAGQPLHLLAGDHGAAGALDPAAQHMPRPRIESGTARRACLLAGEARDVSEQPHVDARAAGDEAAVRATFAAYKAAVLAQQGERAADNVTTDTLREYARYRELALSAPRAALEALPMTERLQVLIIRARVPVADLRAMDGRRVFTHAVDRGWIGREGVERSELGTVQVDGDRAAARLKIGATELPVDFEFEREPGGWRFNLIPLTTMSEDVIKQLARQNGVSENEMVMTLLRGLSEAPVDERLWDPPTP